MPAKVYKVTLNDEERSLLINLTSKGKGSAQKLKHAYILLKADQSENGPRWGDKKISASFDVSIPTIERIRKSFVQGSLESALHRQVHRRSKPLKFDGEKEARLIALACSTPPDGRARWTLRLLADKMVELNHFDEISYETVRQVLKKRTQAPAQKTRVHPARSQC